MNISFQPMRLFPEASSPQIACGGSGFPLGTLDGPPDYVRVTSASGKGETVDVRVFGMDMVTQFDSKRNVRSGTAGRTDTAIDWTGGLTKKVDDFYRKQLMAGFPPALEKAAQYAAPRDMAVFVDANYNVYIGTAKGTGAESQITVFGQFKYLDGGGQKQAPTLVKKGERGYDQPSHGLRGGCGIETARAGRVGGDT